MILLMQCLKKEALEMNKDFIEAILLIIFISAFLFYAFSFINEDIEPHHINGKNNNIEENREIYKEGL